MKIALDGSTNGTYRGDCECGFSWSGLAGPERDALRNPTMAVAETVVHVRMCHQGDGLQLVFSQRFEHWLFKYWQASGTLTEISNGAMIR